MLLEFIAVPKQPVSHLGVNRPAPMPPVKYTWDCAATGRPLLHRAAIRTAQPMTFLISVASSVSDFHEHGDERRRFFRSRPEIPCRLLALKRQLVDAEPKPDRV